MTKVTPDTNVLISGTFWSGDSFKILKLIDQKKIECVLSKEIIREYHRIIQSNEIMAKTKKRELLTKRIVAKVINNSIIVEPTTQLAVITEDEPDNRILEAAQDGKANFVISNDKHLLKLKKYEAIEILNPRAFLLRLQKI